MGDDATPSIILGRAFLATGRALIDVHEEEMVINVFKVMQYPGEEDAENCMRIDAIDMRIKEDATLQEKPTMKLKLPPSTLNYASLRKEESLPGQATSKFGVGKLIPRPHLTMALSSSASFNAHRFRSPFHQSLFEEHVASKSVTPEISFDLQEDQHPEIKEQIEKRGWKRLTKPRTKISNLLTQEFFANAVRTEEKIAEAEAHPYKSYVRGVEINFSVENIKRILRIRDHTPGAESDFDTRQRSDQRLDEVIQEICVPRARWKMSSSQPHQPIQLKRQDLIPLARG
ncbi:hypothetical protein PIB30_062873 [Stylosanthes scabra]|uniref:Putative plant transposon protein domain-containing protein n=1 Tax=Stylosanthes scabra TaxID=79078 RepID=A0ABU6TKZ5_9FABA|nr:hypothetical protein [Stylosanthes scabra]